MLLESTVASTPYNKSTASSKSKKDESKKTTRTIHFNDATNTTSSIMTSKDGNPDVQEATAALKGLLGIGGIGGGVTVGGGGINLGGAVAPAPPNTNTGTGQAKKKGKNKGSQNQNAKATATANRKRATRINSRQMIIVKRGVKTRTRISRLGRHRNQRRPHQTSLGRHFNRRLMQANYQYQHLVLVLWNRNLQ